MTESLIQVSKTSGAVAFVGPDAVDLFRIKTIKRAIAFHKKTGMLMTRGATITKMLDAATKITGKAYKGKTKHDDACADLERHILALECAMPVEVIN